MKRRFYEEPLLEELLVAVECGVELSGDNDSMDYEDGGDGWLLD